MEHHIKVLFVAFFYEFESDIGRHSGGFADGHAVVLAPAFVFELLQIFVKVRSPVIVRRAAHDGRKRIAVRQPFFLTDISDDVFAETVHAHIEPVFVNVDDFLSYFRVIVIQVGLSDGEQVQIIFFPFVVPRPGGAGER